MAQEVPVQGQLLSVVVEADPHSHTAAELVALSVTVVLAELPSVGYTALVADTTEPVLVCLSVPVVQPVGSADNLLDPHTVRWVAADQIPSGLVLVGCWLDIPAGRLVGSLMLKSDPGLYLKVFAGDILAADLVDLVALETVVVVARVVSSDHSEVLAHRTYSVYLGVLESQAVMAH